MVFPSSPCIPSPNTSFPLCRSARCFLVWDVPLTRKQRADLQSGKAVLVEGIKGYDGKTISQYVKANFNQGRLDFYNENPDRKRDASQRNVVANNQRQEQGNRKSKGASIS